MTLSAAGKALLPRAERLLADLDALRREVHDPQQVAGSITVGVMISAMGFVSEALIELKAKHPAIEAHLHLCHPSVQPSQVRSGEFDTAILVEPSQRDFSGLRWTQLYEEPFVLVANAAIATPRSDIGALVRSQPFLRFDRRTPTGARIEQSLRRRGLAPRDHLELNSVMSLVDLVRQGAGVTLVPLLKNAGWEHDPMLCVLPLTGRPALRRVGMLEQTGGSLITRVLREHLIAKLRSLPKAVPATAPKSTRKAPARRASRSTAR
jgi:DNA-binding transcriptional LysR family regulator